MTDRPPPDLTPANDTASNDNRIADDLLFGAEEIAVFLFGTTKQRRRVYHLHAQGITPTFTMGATVCGRRTTLRTWIESQEQAARK
ncbi:hypothetical protein [Azospirillum sp.]|uniref:hypothetical protein n=1 Tax=Azospirillum sp. TaxID=34012 RepID=UPI0026384FAF|nr:hypothetical protein [Azospirillum sp.]